MTDVRRVTLLAALLWISLHLTEAVLYADEHRSAPLLGVAILLAVVLAGASLTPLISSQPATLDLRRGSVLVVGAAAMALCVHPFLTPAGLAGYANWPMGEIGVLVATLVLRECVSCALATTVVVVASNTVAVGLTPTVGWMQGLFLSVPPLTWLLGSLGIRSVLRRSADLREAYVRRGFTFADEERLRRAVQGADDARREELRSRVEPLLRRVEREGGTSRLRTEARLAAEDLRDTLKARSLLTRSLRDQISDARARGVRVTVSSGPATDAAEPALLDHTRELLELLLAEAELGTTLSCRTTSGPPVTMLLVRAPTARETDRIRRVVETSGRLLERSQGGLRAVLEEYDGELLLELRQN
ncbi:hypothetical protein [Nocardioides marmoribigeumensis]|uniref:Histidine kinase n=1 Tax=Nocardioides marmoribigeumensis TaxID=433649 RepID=A0ABU2C0B1_9ACTN|nr:hypothetical protein [Nocardioides marmoribigeumensis]MDR7364081.1 hypothetical protein [Nocardioides marmoribigeumensis]